MKIALIALSLTLLLSCTKDKKEAPESFYFRFKLNGVQKEYLLTNSYFYNERKFLVFGSLDSTNRNTIVVDLESDKKIKSDTTYTERLFPSEVDRRYPLAYIRLSDNHYPGFNYSSSISTPTGAIMHPCTMRILELDANHVKGTVSGKVSNESQTASILITDGEFNIKRTVDGKISE